MGDKDRVTKKASTIRVLLVEDHRLVREVLRVLLEREPDLATAGRWPMAKPVCASRPAWSPTRPSP